METRTFTAVVVEETEEGFEGFSVSVPALPGCYSQGETIKEALANITDALSGYLEALASRHLPLPTEGSALTT
ncbi:MAG: type II toxin-antitoxin system HicB family antitoxin, partial [Chloroflexota bacterium]